MITNQMLTQRMLTNFLVRNLNTILCEIIELDPCCQKPLEVLHGRKGSSAEVT